MNIISNYHCYITEYWGLPLSIYPQQLVEGSGGQRVEVPNGFQRLMKYNCTVCIVNMYFSEDNKGIGTFLGTIKLVKK
jgi:hypothetical protein